MFLTQGANLSIQIWAVHSLLSSRPDSARSKPMSRPDSARSRPMSSPDSAKSRYVSLHSNWPSTKEIPTRLDSEEEEVIEIDEDDDYEPPEPGYEPGSPRPEPREEDPRGHNANAPNKFTNSNASGRGRGIQGIQ